MGLIDFALSPFIRRITCVDKSAEALRSLDRLRSSRGVSNIETVLSDVSDIRGYWDTCLAVFFGDVEALITRHLKLCGDVLIAVVHADAQGRLGPEAYHPKKCLTVSGAVHALHALGVSYTLSEHALEYGQPFETREDAAAFVCAYSKNPPGTAVEAYLRERLEQTSDARFPYYLPNLKRFGVFVIPRGANTRFVETPEG